MGYVLKEKLMEVLSNESNLTQEDLSYIKKSLVKDKLYDDTLLKLNVINQFEQRGILREFYNVCKAHGYFPQWLKNVEEQKDFIV